MHIDAAYAGSAFICPEFRPLLNGVEVCKRLETFIFMHCTDVLTQLVVQWHKLYRQTAAEASLEQKHSTISDLVTFMWFQSSET